MTPPLDYAPPPARQRSKWLARAAAAALFFPIIVVAPLYIEWLLARTADIPAGTAFYDPKYNPASSWMHDITGLALLAIVPAAVLALTLTIAHLAVNRPPLRRAIARCAILAFSWIALFGLLYWDPGRILYWWLD